MSFVLAEGAYTSYAIYDSFDDADIALSSHSAAWVNCLETKAILIIITSTKLIKVYDIDAKTLGSSTELSSIDLYSNDMMDWIFKKTFLNTYAAFIEVTTESLLIYKNGVLLQTITLTNLGLTSWWSGTVSFSPRGKYIFLTGIRTASGNKGWVVLKGT